MKASLEMTRLLSGLLHSPVHIIGEKVDHLTNSGLAKRAVGELQSLSADKKIGLK